MHKFGIGSMAVGLALSVGCGSQIGEEALVGCLEDSREATPLNDVADGFTESPADALARLAGTFTGSSDLGAGDTTFRVTPIDQPYVVRRSWRSESDDGREPAMPLPESDCPDIYAFPSEVQLTVTGQLDETVVSELQVTTEGAASVWTTIDLSELTGPAEPPFDPSTKEVVELQISAWHDGGAWQGEANWFYEDPPSGTGPDSTVSAGTEPMLDFTCQLPPG